MRPARQGSGARDLPAQRRCRLSVAVFEVPQRLADLCLSRDQHANRASMTEKRSRVRQSRSLAERLAADAVSLREQAARLEPGAERDALLKKAHRNKMAADINTCLTSPGRRPPA